MNRIVLFLIVAVVLLACVSCQESQVTREDVDLTLDSLEHKLVWLDYRLALERWDKQARGEADSLGFYTQLYNDVVSDNRAFNVMQKGKSLISDEVPQRRWELLFERVLLGQVEAVPEIAGLRDSLASATFFNEAEFEGSTRTGEYLYLTYRRDKSRDRRESAFRACCAAGPEMADGLERLIRLRNQRSGQLGYNSYLGLSFAAQRLNTSDFLSLMEDLTRITEQPYLDILRSIEQKLNLNKIELWDLDYAYAETNAEVDRYFPRDSQLAFVKSALEGIDIDLDKMPVYFDSSTADIRSSRFAQAFAVKSPYDMRVLVNPSDGIRSNRALMREVGRALHAAFITEEQPLFKTLLEDSWSRGMAQVFAAVCDDSTWLAEYAHMPPTMIERFRQARHDQAIIDLRLALTGLMFEYEAYANSNRDLNRLYWDLFERYMMLPRHEDLKPWAVAPHYAAQPIFLQHSLHGNIIAAQTQAFMVKNYGGIVDNEMTRSFLVQNYLRFGSRYDWRELLERGTGEKLNPDYLVGHAAL